MPLPLIRDPVTLSILQRQVIRNPPVETAPAPMTLYATSAAPEIPAVRLKPGRAETFQYPLTAAEDAPQILAYLQSLAVQFATSTYIRETCQDILDAAGVGNNDLEGQVEAVLYFVRRNLTYARDPIDSEFVISPVYLLEKIAAGKAAYCDCEDHVLLLNSLLSSIGFPTRFVAVKINGESDWFNHVIASVYAGGRWWDLDPSAKGIVQPDYPQRLEGATNYGGAPAADLPDPPIVAPAAPPIPQKKWKFQLLKNAEGETVQIIASAIR